MSEEEEQAPATAQQQQQGNVNNNQDAAADGAADNAAGTGGDDDAEGTNSSSNDRDEFGEVYIDNKKFFDGLQEAGKQLTEKEIRERQNNPTKKKRMHITKGDKCYKDTYEFAKCLDTHYRSIPEILPKVRKNESAAIHMIGEHLLELRQTTNRADMHKVVTDGIQLGFANGDDYKDKDILSFLPQKTWVDWIVSKWANNESDVKQSTADDMVRAVGIMFMEDMREYIPYLLTEHDPCANSVDGTRGRRLSIDEWSSKRKLAKRHLHTKFIDLDCEVTLHNLWGSDDARERIDGRLGDGAYDNLNINPNNPERIQIAFTEDEVLHHFTAAILAYNGMMRSYKMNTGGGSGDSLDVVLWNEREPLEVVGYTTNRQELEVYLTAIHLWDKEYGFPLTVVKEKGIDDGIDDDDADYGNNNGDDWDVRTTSTPGTARSKHGKDQLQLQSILRQQKKSQKEDRKEFMNEMVAVMKEGLKSAEGEGESTVDKQAKLQEAIARTEQQLETAKVDFKAMKKKRKKEQEMSQDSPSNKKLQKRFNEATAGAKLAAKKVRTFELTLESQLDELHKLSSAAGNDDKSDDGFDLSDVSDDSDDE